MGLYLAHLVKGNNHGLTGCRVLDDVKLTTCASIGLHILLGLILTRLDQMVCQIWILTPMNQLIAIAIKFRLETWWHATVRA
jgi:hypothetical protein